MMRKPPARIQDFCDIPKLLCREDSSKPGGREPGTGSRDPGSERPARIRRMKILHGAAFAVSLVLIAISLNAQEAAKYGADPNYKVPRLANGQPDLQGVWGNNGVTPMT